MSDDMGNECRVIDSVSNSPSPIYSLLWTPVDYILKPLVGLSDDIVIRRLFSAF